MTEFSKLEPLHELPPDLSDANAMFVMMSYL